jgi:hypothetical protein
MNLGHVTPFRVHSRAFAPFFLHKSYYIYNNHIFMQQILTTHKGYVGLAHSQVVVGDYICVL